MPNFVQPTVWWIGTTTARWGAIEAYLRYTHNEEFIKDIDAARVEGISDGEILVSLYAKLCYKSLSVGKNANISRTRSIADNLEGCYDVAHGSVFEHCNLNFIVTDCSRVYTHEQVRHRVGVAYSQTSGRYVRGDTIDFIEDLILGPKALARGRALLEHIEREYRLMVEDSGIPDDKDFASKKKKTSALRRYLPNGQGNEMGMTLNIRTLRHCVQTRTSRHAEREIRLIYQSVYQLVKAECPLMFHGAKETLIDDILEISGMRMQPYDLTVEDAIKSCSLESLQAEVTRRT